MSPRLVLGRVQHHHVHRGQDQRRRESGSRDVVETSEYRQTRGVPESDLGRSKLDPTLGNTCASCRVLNNVESLVVIKNDVPDVVVVLPAGRHCDRTAGDVYAVEGQNWLDDTARCDLPVGTNRGGCRLASGVAEAEFDDGVGDVTGAGAELAVQWSTLQLGELAVACQ